MPARSWNGGAADEERYWRDEIEKMWCLDEHLKLPEEALDQHRVTARAERTA